MKTKTIQHQMSDAAIIKLIVQEGKNELFGILYGRYYTKVLGKSRTLCKNEEDALDMTQDIFTIALSKLSTFEGRSSFSTWLYHITFNHNICFLRKKKKRKYSTLDDKIQLEDHSSSLYEDKVKKEATIIDLFSLMESLDFENKAILLLKYKENKSIDELATLYNIKSSALKMRLLRARKKLLKLYQANMSVDNENILIQAVA